MIPGPSAYAYSLLGSGAEAIRLACTRGNLRADITGELGVTGESLRLWLTLANLGETYATASPPTSWRNTGNLKANTLSCARCARSRKKAAALFWVTWAPCRYRSS